MKKGLQIAGVAAGIVRIQKDFHLALVVRRDQSLNEEGYRVVAKVSRRVADSQPTPGLRRIGEAPPFGSKRRAVLASPGFVLGEQPLR